MLVYSSLPCYATWPYTKRRMFRLGSKQYVYPVDLTLVIKLNKTIFIVLFILTLVGIGNWLSYCGVKTIFVALTTFNGLEVLLKH